MRVGDKTNGVYKDGETGIDGVYKHPDPPPDYVITEAKYNTAKLDKTVQGDGTIQMEDDWVRNRLDKKVDFEDAEKIRDAMDKGRVEKWKVQVKPDGSTGISKIDRSGNVIRGKAGRVN